MFNRAEATHRIKSRLFCPDAPVVERLPMSSPPIVPEAGTPAPRLRRRWRHGLRCFFRFTGGKGSLSDGFEGMLALAGPMVQREFDRFAEHPLGRKLLAERPRRDLNALLVDRPALEAMSKGSFADAYLDYMGAEGMGSASYFLEAAGLDDKAAQFGWSDDQLWFVKRMANSHDIFHVVSGYDRSIIGEVGVDAYTAGHMPMLPLRLFLAYLLLLKPSSPIGWTSYVLRCYRHGRETPPLSCVDWEAILELPLEEARRQMNVKSLDEIHPSGFPGPGKKLLALERNLNGG